MNNPKRTVGFVLAGYLFSCCVVQAFRGNLDVAGLYMAMTILVTAITLSELLDQ